MSTSCVFYRLINSLQLHVKQTVCLSFIQVPFYMGEAVWENLTETQLLLTPRVSLNALIFKEGPRFPLQSKLSTPVPSGILQKNSAAISKNGFVRAG